MAKVTSRNRTTGRPSTPAEATVTAPAPALAVERRLVFNAMDSAGYVADTHKAYRAVEGLVTTVGAGDSESLAVDRSDLGALLKVLNDTMGKHIQDTCDATELVMKSLPK